MTPRTSPPVALVTGATGFLGSNLAVELLARGRARIFCLVRPGSDAAERLDRAVRTAAEIGGNELPDDVSQRVVPIHGDVTAPDLALDALDDERLRSEPPTEVWHAAASLRYEDEHREEILRVNADGTRNVVEVAATLGVPALHHVSTAYVAGLRVGPVEEGPYDATHEPNNWYEVSKRRGEDLVDAHAHRFDVVKVHRPSIIVGSSTTYRSTSRSGYYGFLSGLDRFRRLAEQAEPGYLSRHPLRLLGAADSALDLVPVNVVVAEAVALADDPDATGRYFHLTNPYPVTLGRLAAALRTVLPDLRIEFVDDRSALRPFDVAFDDAIDFYRPYLGNDKQFVRARDGGTPPAALRFDDDALVALSLAHFESRTRTAGAVDR
jgi:nucleoside-diphosphate-sugar epimerase